MSKVIVLAMLTVLLTSLAAVAGDTAPTQRAGTDYTLLELSILDYYQMYGTWPQTWQAVRDSGLFTAATLAADGSVINPDDNSLDFAGDITYTYHGQDRPELTVWSIVDGQKYEAARRVPWVQPRADGAAAPNALQIRLLVNVFQAVTRFAALQHRLPASWNELIDNGVTAIDSSSINPLTGRKYMGNGIPGDFLFEKRTDAAGKLELRIQWVGLDGHARNLGTGWFSMPEEEQGPNRTYLKMVP